MEDQTGNVISILGFYLSLVSLLGSLFIFTWEIGVKQIQITQQKWNRYKNEEDSSENRGKKIECYLESFDEKNLLTLISFLLLTIFMVLLGEFALHLKFFLPEGNNVGYYLYQPGYIFFLYIQFFLHSSFLKVI